ncbi:MAG: protein translocase subunit SecD [Planctomycetota bacterium]
MLDHISRKVTFLFVLLAVAVLALWSMGFRMGLDLQGGTRLEYSIDFERALKEGAITQAQFQTKDQLINELIGVWTERVDPTGVKGVTIRPEGANRVVIELPGSASATRREVSQPLGSEVGAGDVALYLAEPTDIELPADPNKRIARLEEYYRDFPSAGGHIEIDGEQMRYGKRVGNMLRSLERGGETPAAAHAAGAKVTLKASDPWRQLIENTGEMHFYIEAGNQDFIPEGGVRPSTDLETQKARVLDWIQRNPNAPIRDFNAELASDPNPDLNRLRWYPMATKDPNAQFEDLLRAVIEDRDPNYRFSGTDFPNFYPSQDNLGLPAVGFASVPERANDFGDFTEEHEGDQMAIVINDEIITFPVINSRLQGGGIIEGGPGGFTATEVNDLIRVMRSGSLRIRPDFEAQETVGATLGSDYVRRGFLSAIAGLVVVLLFMAMYYRRLGVLAGVSLLFNLVILMGAMAFMQATLTLPGVAGIILTVGMAVDANILIYERIREEQLKGRKPLQSARDGFKNATSTIVDANLTTLITGLILYKVGTGPVRGFATTLCVGIVTSMISVLVLTRVLVHLALERGVENWSMMRWVTESKIDFVGKAKGFITASTLLVIGSLVLFGMQPTIKSMGIEFTGGISGIANLENAMTPDAMRGMFDPGKNENLKVATTLTKTIQIKPILASSSGDGYLAYRFEAKSKERNDSMRSEVQNILAPVLQRGPVEVSVTEGTATGTLYFDASHPVADIEAALAKSCNISEPKVTATEGKKTIYGFTGQVLGTKTSSDVSLDIQAGLDALRDQEGSLLSLSSPIPELNAVGATVVGEMRDKALLAVVLSLFAAVMYIRVRFAEYSYGFAAVIALVHDVSMTLGALAIMTMTGWVRAEIDLAMIAALLTIIGYSLNDTIVVFDRVRENLPRMKGDLSSIINTSINQTLSRTLLTSGTTLFSVVLLFVFNVGTNNVVEGFSFAMFIGIVVGTYSSIYIASPALVWLETRRLRKLEAEQAAEAAKPRTATQA